MRKVWEKIVKAILAVPEDKRLHFAVSLIIAAFCCITLDMGAWCVVPVFFIGFIKEFIDKWRGGAFDWYDLIADLAGGMVISLFAII